MTASTSSPAPQPPRLLVRTLGVILATVALLLIAVFVFVFVSVRDQVRQSVAAGLESGQRIYAAVENRRQRELQSQAATLAENPTLKATIDTYAAEARTASQARIQEWLATIDNELEKVAARVDSDALILADTHQTTLAAAGRLGDRWPRGRPIAMAAGKPSDTIDGVVRAGGMLFRVVSVPLQLADVPIGTLYLAENLDDRYAKELASLANAEIAIVSDGLLVASTLPQATAREFEAAAASRQPDGTAVLDGQSYAFRRLVQLGSTSFYALGSIDESSRAATRTAIRNLALIAAGAAALALIASFWLARMLSEPVGRLSASLAAAGRTPGARVQLARTGSSREVDTLTDTFNALMASVAKAEEETQAAYTGSIRALATALDARDPYTAGHSERVSVLSVAIARELKLPDDDIEVIRLGALLHDIGKIGVPDEVLLKAGALTEAEFNIIKQHPVAGARILRSVPFLLPHIPIVELHHERPDGRGYPHGLRGDEIPMHARIVHVADAYDAITSKRAYRNARPSGDALREIWRFAGTEFHAEVVGALATALPGVTSDTGELVVDHGEQVHA
ncbi:MAG TPA: HD-GYP domain-containing protein [Vicinamibacterales bacterium]|nr:HD-GYP domain-containing protein [Vicinamibacterales bacterium]